jgi:hypothetical protein
MELNVHDKITKNPAADDVTRAIDATPHADDWFINLDPDDGSYIEAFAQTGGTFSLVSVVQKRRFNAAAPVDAARLKTILIKYLHGDASWRAECQWKADQAVTKAPAAARDTSAPPQWAIAVVVATIGVVVLCFSSAWVRSFIPYSNSDYFFIGLIALPMVVLVLVMLAVKLGEARRASHWPQTTGKILKSGTQAHHHQFSGETTTVTTVPAVEYEFTANGRSWRGNRIGIGEDSGGANTEATLKHYPVGAAVTVYYDPNDPGHCVLERDIPKGMGKGCAIIVAAGAAIVFGVWYIATNASHLLENYLQNGEAPVTIFAALFGLAVLLFFFASRNASKKAANWPVVSGTIVSSGTESYQKREDGRTTTYYTAAVEFAYQVHRVNYRSRQIKLGVSVSGSQTSAEKTAARYPQGSKVDVHYDPDNPSNAALENSTGFTWLLLAVALACFGIAVYASGIFK